MLSPREICSSDVEETAWAFYVHQSLCEWYSHSILQHMDLLFSAMNSANVDFVPSYWWSLAGFTTNLFSCILSRNSQVDRNTQHTESHRKFLRKIIMVFLKSLFNEMRLTLLYLVVNMSYSSNPHYEFGSYMQPASGKSLPIPFVMERQLNNHHVDWKWKPTRCHLSFYCTSYRLNMFRALLCPSSGARDCNVYYHIDRFVLGLL